MVNTQRIQIGNYVYYPPLKIEGTVVELNRTQKSATLRVEEDDKVEMIAVPLADLVVVHHRFIRQSTTSTTNEPLTIEIKYFDDEIERIEKIKKGSWIDLRAAEEVNLESGQYYEVPLGVGMKLPDGYEAHVMPRSSTYKKYHVIQTNSKGLIDNSYSGDNDQWKLPVYATESTTIPKNDRICQFRIVEEMPEIRFKVVDRLEEESRGGFGSTGSE